MQTLLWPTKQHPAAVSAHYSPVPETHRALDGGLVGAVALDVAQHVEVPARQGGVARPPRRRDARKVQLPRVLPHPHLHGRALQ